MLKKHLISFITANLLLEFNNSHIQGILIKCRRFEVAANQISHKPLDYLTAKNASNEKHKVLYTCMHGKSIIVFLDFQIVRSCSALFESLVSNIPSCQVNTTHRGQFEFAAATKSTSFLYTLCTTPTGRS